MEIVYKTTSSEIASIAVECGVNIIMVDLGKHLKETKDYKSTFGWTFDYEAFIQDCFVKLKKIRASIGDKKLRVVVTAEMDDSVIDELNNIGVDEVYLSQWTEVDEVRRFISKVGRDLITGVVFNSNDEIALAEAVFCSDIKAAYIDTLELFDDRVEEYKMIANGTIDKICSKAKGSNVAISFGDVRFIKSYPSEAEFLIAELCNANASSVLLSCTFNGSYEDKYLKDAPIEISENVSLIREQENKWNNASKEAILDQRKWMLEDYLIAKKNIIDIESQYSA